MNKRKIAIVLIPLGIILLGYGLMKFLASQKVEPEKTAPPMIKTYVKVDTVRYSAIETSVGGFGKVSSSQSIHLVAEVSGELLEADIPLKAAQEFRKNQTVFRINDKEARMNLISQRSEYQNFLVSILPDIKIDYTGSYSKWEKFYQSIDINKPLPSLPEIADSKEKAFLTGRKILSQYYAIKGTEEKLSKYSFEAPFDGSIADLKIQSGSIINTGAQIGRIIKTSEMEVEIPVKAENIGWVTIGNSLNLASQDNTMKWKGKVVRIGDHVDPLTQSISVYASVVPNENHKLFDGFYLLAEIPGKQISDAMEISRAALVNNNQVYTVKNGKLNLRQINIKKINQKTIVFNGLEEGELVVIEAIVNAIENTEVNVFK